MIIFIAGYKSNKASYDKPIVESKEGTTKVDIHSLLHEFSGSNSEINSTLESLEKDSLNPEAIDLLEKAGAINNIDLFKAYAFYLKGIMNKDTSLLLKAGHLFFETGTHDMDSNRDKSVYGVYAIRACDRVLSIDDKNINALVIKGTSIVYFGGAPMQGVGLLKQAESIDSNHLNTQHHLMLLDLQSGQYNFAIKRLKKLVHLQPQNQQYADLLLRLETQQIK